MSKENQPVFLSHFDDLEDPRIERNKLHPLPEILLIVLCGSICGAQSWRDFVTFGEEKLDYLQRFLPYNHGVPSKNTFARVLSSLDPTSFKTCFLAWIQSFQQVVKEVVAIDGKTLRKSFDKATEISAIHMVSAFATSTQLVLGQEKVNEKSNEIKAIPKLLDLLALEGAIVSIDAMGTQKQVANKIRQKQADYVLALKRNHGTLHTELSEWILHEIERFRNKQTSRIIDFNETFDKGHGRIEQRTCYITDQIDWLAQKKDWPDLKSVAMIESSIEANGKLMTEQRFFISSLPPHAKELADAVRSHWAIENSLHWVLDVTLGEDNSRIRKDYAPQNMAIVRHIILNLLQNTKRQFKDMSIKRLQKKAGWGDSTLDSILMQKF